ncbi:MAG TPA: hypothetical protein VGK34_08860 [Armatimonadota bacterium]
MISELNVPPMKRIAERQLKLGAVVELNRKYNMFAGIHNHFGLGMDASLWAMPWSKAATEPGAPAVKDFLWEKRKGWQASKFCPLGQGMVDLKTFLRYLKEIKFASPLSADL